MPWSVERRAECPAAKPWAVIADDTGEVVACHDTQADAERQLQALYVNVPDARAAAVVEVDFAPVDADPRFYVDRAAALTDPIPDVPPNPPRRYFQPPPEMGRATKLTVVTAGVDTGRVYGYVADWDTCLLNGDERHECLRPPKSASGYMAAMQGDTVLDDGGHVATANLGGGVNHAAEGDMAMAVDHYANIASQLARVRYGEDSHGIWLAGALWPHVTWADVATMRASAVSGDWRWRREIAAYLGDPKGWDLAGVQLVNSPGYPLYRVVAAATPMIVAEPAEEPMTHTVPPTTAPVVACACQTPAQTAAPGDPMPPENAGDGDTGRLDAIEAAVGDLAQRVAAIEETMFAAELAALDSQAAALRLPTA